MGPQHPSTHGVLQVKLKLDGERVLDAECVIGYLHRGVEKLGEVQTYGQFVPTLDRMDYIAAVSNCLGYCETIEKLLGVTAPPRAQYIRLQDVEWVRKHLGIDSGQKYYVGEARVEDPNYITPTD